MTKKEYKDFIVWLIKPAIDAFKEGLKERDIVTIVGIVYTLFAVGCIVALLITRLEIIMFIFFLSMIIGALIIVAIILLQIKYEEYLDEKGEGD